MTIPQSTKIPDSGYTGFFGFQLIRQRICEAGREPGQDKVDHNDEVNRKYARLTLIEIPEALHCKGAAQIMALLPDGGAPRTWADTHRRWKIAEHAPLVDLKERFVQFSRRYQRSYN